MWSSIAQNVVELLVPHLGTAVSRAFNKQSPDTDASRTAIEQVTQNLRGDLGQVTAAHASLYRQLNEQSDKLSTLASDTHSIKLQTSGIEDRLILLERRSSIQQKLAVAALFLLSACAVLLLILLFHHP